MGVSGPRFTAPQFHHTHFDDRAARAVTDAAAVKGLPRTVRADACGQSRTASASGVKTACAGLGGFGVTLAARGALGDCHVLRQTLRKAHAPARKRA